MARIHVKDKEDFMKAYNDPHRGQSLREIVAYREFGNKVEVKILVPLFQNEALSMLKAIKD